MSVARFLTSLNKAQLENALQQQMKIEEFLKMSMNPPGRLDRWFNTDANSEFEKARASLNPTGHARTNP